MVLFVEIFCVSLYRNLDLMGIKSSFCLPSLLKRAMLSCIGLLNNFFQESQNADELWETVSVWAQDVKRYTCTGMQARRVGLL